MCGRRPRAAIAYKVCYRPMEYSNTGSPITYIGAKWTEYLLHLVYIQCCVGVVVLT